MPLQLKFDPEKFTCSAEEIVELTRYLTSTVFHAVGFLESQSGLEVDLTRRESRERFLEWMETQGSNYQAAAVKFREIFDANDERFDEWCERDREKVFVDLFEEELDSEDCIGYIGLSCEEVKEWIVRGKFVPTEGTIKFISRKGKGKEHGDLEGVLPEEAHKKFNDDVIFALSEDMCEVGAFGIAFVGGHYAVDCPEGLSYRWIEGILPNTEEAINFSEDLQRKVEEFEQSSEKFEQFERAVERGALYLCLPRENISRKIVKTEDGKYSTTPPVRYDFTTVKEFIEHYGKEHIRWAHELE